MLIRVIPPLEFAILYFFRYLMRAYDQKKCCVPKLLPKSTRKKTFEAYKRLYEGPEFDMDYMYA